MVRKVWQPCERLIVYINSVIARSSISSRCPRFLLKICTDSLYADWSAPGSKDSTCLLWPIAGRQLLCGIQTDQFNLVYVALLHHV